MAVVESFIPVPTTSLKLDGVAVTTSEGLAVREMVTIGDPETTAARAAVTGSHPSHGEYGLVTRSIVYPGDSVAFDAFGRLRVSPPHTIFDAQQEYGLDTLRVWDATANGTLSSASPSTNGSVTSAMNWHEQTI